MADEKVNVSPEEKKAPEAPAPSGPGDPPAPEAHRGARCPWWRSDGPRSCGARHAGKNGGAHQARAVCYPWYG